MRITISDIAQYAGVSKATVSAVLNERPGISVQTRERVLEIIQKLNYQPSHVARSLSNRETKSIGLLIKEIDNPYFAKIMKGVFDKCSELGYTVLLGSSELDPAQEKKSLEALLRQQVDGLILSPLQNEEIDLGYLYELKLKNYPFVTLGSVVHFQTNVVEVENKKAAVSAVSYLIHAGHKRIAYFAGPSYSANSKDRLAGFRQAFHENAIPAPEDLIFNTGSYIADGYRMGRELFALPGTKPSAVFCYNDLVAIGLMNALAELKIQVPADVSVIGFDDIDFCRSMQVPLTTIRVPAYKLGEKAAELLIAQIGARDESKNRKVILPAQLIERKSVAPLGRDGSGSEFVG